MSEHRCDGRADKPHRAALRGHRRSLADFAARAGARFRFTLMQVAWRVGMADSPTALIVLAVRAARRSGMAIMDRFFNAAVWRGRSGKRDTILSTR